MPWVQQKNGRRYYYRHSWQNGRLCQKYLGNGVVAELAAKEDSRRQAAQLADNHAVTDWGNKLRNIDHLVTHSGITFNRLLTAGLLTAGFYQQDRHAWTKRQYNRRCCSSPSKNSAA